MAVTPARNIAFVYLAAILVLCLSGCTNANFTTGPIAGQPGAPLVFVEGLNPPGFSPLVGFDISFSDSSGNYYLSSSAYTAGVLEINTGQMTSFTEPTVLGAGKTSFVGSMNPGYVTLDTAHQYEGGPNGVVAFYNPKAPTLSSALGAEEVWAADDAQFVAMGNPFGMGTYGYTQAGQWMCNSRVQIYNTNNGEWHSAYTNGCFKADEISADPDDGIVLVANPEENSNLVTNLNSGAFPGQYVPSGPSSGVPTAPFISLISTSTTDSESNYVVVKQIAFDGTNGTPNATNILINVGSQFPLIMGGIEQPVYSPETGYFYVAVPNDLTQGENASNGAIAVIDPKAKAFVKKFNLSNCSPDGMALGPDGKEALLACNSTTGPQLINLETGAEIASFAQSVPAPTDGASLAIYAQAGNMCDEAAYNPTTNVYVVACQFAYNNALVSVINAGTGLTGASFVQNLFTNPTAISAEGAAHSVSTDPITGAVIVPLPMGDSLCPSYVSSSNVGVGCLGIWAPQGSWLQKGAY